MTQTVLTIGATSGLGRATAAGFAQQGRNAIAPMCQVTTGVVRSRTGTTLVTRLDVQDSVSIPGAIAVGIAPFGRIDVAMNDA